MNKDDFRRKELATVVADCQRELEGGLPPLLEDVARTEAAVVTAREALRKAEGVAMEAKGRKMAFVTRLKGQQDRAKAELARMAPPAVDAFQMWTRARERAVREKLPMNLPFPRLGDLIPYQAVANREAWERNVRTRQEEDDYVAELRGAREAAEDLLFSGLPVEELANELNRLQGELDSRRGSYGRLW